MFLLTNSLVRLKNCIYKTNSGLLLLEGAVDELVGLCDGVVRSELLAVWADDECPDGVITAPLAERYMQIVCEQGKSTRATLKAYLPSRWLRRYACADAALPRSR